MACALKDLLLKIYTFKIELTIIVAIVIISK